MIKLKDIPKDDSQAKFSQDADDFWLELTDPENSNKFALEADCWVLLLF